MNKDKILNLVDAIPDDISFENIVIELLKKPGISQTTLGTFAHSSKSAMSRIKRGQKPLFITGIMLLKLYATLCLNSNDDEKGKQ